MRTKSRLLFKKGAIEVLFYLQKTGKAGYYEIYKQNFIISRQSFSNLLKELENKGLLDREVINGRLHQKSITA